MIKSIFFLLLAFALQVQSDSCTNSNDNYFIILGDYTSTDTGELNALAPHTNQNVWYLNGSQWVHSNQTLPGLEGNGASLWYYFGNYLNQKTGQDVYIADLSKNNARAYDWTDINNNDSYWGLFNQTISVLPKNTVVNVLWMQGENDANDLSCQLPHHYSGLNHYSNQLVKLIDWSPKCYQWGISLTSYSPFHTVSAQNYVRTQQARVVNEFSNASQNSRQIWAGPDTDRLCHPDRYKDTYFNIQGMDLAASGWANSLAKMNHTLDPSQPYCDYYLIDIDLIFWSVIRFIVLIAFIGLFATMCFMCCSWCQSQRTRQITPTLPKYSYDRPVQISEKQPLI